MCWREHSRPQEAGPAAQEHSTLCPPPGEQTSVDRGWICSLDSGEHSWGSWESGKDGGGWQGAKSEGTQQHQRSTLCTQRRSGLRPPGESRGAQHLCLHLPSLHPGGGHTNPLQCPCLENPMDRGAWRATVHGVAKVRNNLAIKPSPPVSAPALLFPSHTPLMQRRPSALRIGSQCHLPSLTKL